MTDTLHLTAVFSGTGETGCAYLVHQLLWQGLNRKTALMTPRHSFVDEKPLPLPQGVGWRAACSNVLEHANRVGCTHAVLTLPWDRLRAGEAEDLMLETAVVTDLREEDVDQTAAFLQTHTQQLACNLDDPAVRRLAAGWRGTCCTYAESRVDGEVTGRNLRLLPTCTAFDALTRRELCRVTLPVSGGFDLYQGLAALSWGQLHGLTLARCAGVLRSAWGEPGRMVCGQAPGGQKVLSDGADQPEALEGLLLTARGMTQGDLVLVLAVSPDTPPATRWELGLVARLADRVCFTLRSAEGQKVPRQFFRELELGAGLWHSAVHPAAGEALQWAWAQATPADLVVLAGQRALPPEVVPTQL